MDLELTREEGMDAHETVAVRTGEAGFSLIEAMIAVGILLFIAIGMMPLFYRAFINNGMGNDYSLATTHGKTDLEENLKKPFENVDLTLTAGGSLQTVRYLQRQAFQTAAAPVTDLDWAATAPNAGTVSWTKTTRVRQFGVTAFSDGVLADTEALPAGTAPSFVQIKEVTTFLDSGKLETGSSPFASIGRTTLQVMKPF